MGGTTKFLKDRRGKHKREDIQFLQRSVSEIGGMPEHDKPDEFDDDSGYF